MLQLRPYQHASIEGLRAHMRNGGRAPILMAPTGAGKTVLAVALMQGVVEKMARAAFVVDRVSLVDQTSATFDQYGIPHGVMQGSHWRCRPYERIQICSVQTLARRGFPEGLELLIVDECHTVFKAITDFIKNNPTVRVIGLSATPFTKGLASIYDGLVNVVTQEQLIEEGFLCPIKAYAAVSPDMKGAAVKFDGEWAEADLNIRCGQIVAEERGLLPAEGLVQAKHFLTNQAKKRVVAMGPDQARQEMLALAVLDAQLGAETRRGSK
mgnify:CR=1 FL=1